MPTGHLALIKDRGVSGAEPARDLQVKPDGVADHARQEALERTGSGCQQQPCLRRRRKPLCDSVLSTPLATQLPPPPHAPRTQGEGKLSNGVERTSRRSPAFGGTKVQVDLRLRAIQLLGNAT